MHELSIAQEIITIVKDNLPDSSSKVKIVRIKVGKLSGVLSDSLKFCYDSLVQNTELDGSNIEIEEIPLKLYCKKCEYEFINDDFVFYCTKCGSSEIELKEGNELFISEIELLNNEEQP